MQLSRGTQASATTRAAGAAPRSPAETSRSPKTAPVKQIQVMGSGELGGSLTGFPAGSTAELGCYALLHLRRSLALRDLFQVKMLVLPGPKLFPGGCPVLYLVRHLVVTGLIVLDGRNDVVVCGRPALRMQRRPLVKKAVECCSGL